MYTSGPPSEGGTMTEQELARGAARRLAIIQHSQEVTGNVSAQPIGGVADRWLRASGHRVPAAATNGTSAFGRRLTSASRECLTQDLQVQPISNARIHFGRPAR